MATVTTTITISVTLTRQTGQWSVLNHSQTNSQPWAQPIGFGVCCLVHLCISLGKHTWWLILILLQGEGVQNSGKTSTDVRGRDMGVEEGTGKEIGGRRNENATIDVRSYEVGQDQK